MIKKLTFIVFLLFLASGCQERGPTNPVASQTPINTPNTTTPIPGPNDIAPELIEPPTPYAEIPHSVDILEMTAFRTGDNSSRIIGLMKNNSNHSITDIKLIIRIYSPDDFILAEEIAFISLSTIEPGVVAPFFLRLDTNLEEKHRIEGQIVEFRETQEAYVDVIIQNQVTVTDENSIIQTSGEILNNNLSPIEIHAFTAAVFDQDGTLINVDSNSINIQYMDPGEISPYRTTIQGTTGVELDRLQIKLYIDAKITNPEDYLDIEIDNNPNHYFDRFDNFHLVTKISNNTEDPLNIYFVAAIYDSSGQVIDAAKTGLPLPSLHPGESFPIDFVLWGPLNGIEATSDLMESFSVQWDPFLTEKRELEYVDLTIAEVERQLMPRYGIFKGTILNKTDLDISNAIINVSIYDRKSGNILATKSQDFDTGILHGGSIDYYLVPEFSINMDIEEINIQIKALGVISE